MKGASPVASDCSAYSHTCSHRAKEGTRAQTEDGGFILLGGRSLRAPKAESRQHSVYGLSLLWRSSWTQIYETSKSRKRPGLLPGPVLGSKYQLLQLLKWVTFLLCFWNCKLKITGSVSNGCWGWKMVHLKYSAPGWYIRISFWMFVFFLSAS